MKQYLNLLQHILDNGVKKDDRTGTGTISCFGYQMRFNLQDGFPLVTTKKVHLKSIIHELLWFLMGSTNIKYLKDNGVRIWDEWADKDGELGPVYGKQWRSWPNFQFNRTTELDVVDEYFNHPIDQISDLIAMIKKNPDSRRLIVSAWNPADVPKQALPPCHCLFQFHVRDATQTERCAWANERGKLPRLNATMLDLIHGTEEDIKPYADVAGAPTKVISCQLYQRSADVFLGVPFNIASYALLTMMVAQVCDMIPGDFIHTFGDVHIYSNHMDQVKLQLSREPRKLPRMVINPDVKDIFGFKYEDFRLEGYDPHPKIEAPVAV